MSAASLKKKLTGSLQKLNLDARIQLMSGQLNRLTGYERIEKLKAVVIDAEQAIKHSRGMLVDSKQEYGKYTEMRRSSQKQVNDLLSNKSSWGDVELNRFTQLVKSDHSIEKLEKEYSGKVEEYERLVDRGFEKLLKSILERYHEEQIWSDKIRSVSSNYTLMALSVNVLVFLTAIVFVEPWKRSKMLKELEINLDQDQIRLLGEIDSMRDDIRSLKPIPAMSSSLVPPPPSPPTTVDSAIITNNPFASLSLGIFLLFMLIILPFRILLLVGLGLCVYTEALSRYKGLFDVNLRCLWNIICVYLAGVGCSLLVYEATTTHGDMDSKAFIPALTYIVIALTLFYPFDAFYKQQRSQFLSTLTQIIYSPVTKAITFNQVFLADILTSYAKVFGDFYSSIIQCLDPESSFAITPQSANYMAPLFTTIPYLLRLRQCVVEYIASDYQQKRSLANALKYASALPVIAFSAIHKHNKSVYPWWLISVVVNSLYSFWWDVRNDWGLNFLDRDVWLDGGVEKTPLRQTLLYRQPGKYYAAILADFFLRFTWSLKLSSHLHAYVQLESGVFAFEILEILRRYLWCLFRLEWEVIKTEEYPSIPIHQYTTE
ncbi:hypothetical protein E3P94_02014 [Wallemia ichthyophaga]|uniref:Sensitive to high expression protein 9, mitochondrial n=1 Tax=Wallemia ichthyophaga TaxID=245174 RepID=A0A4T0GHT2_WALIC|nr:hypothetical protein E3P95_01628 [Wallemia ichthyophaga]TIB01013.1 hypothetical protein E3P94_02014 [Wallemia ichthyophaga]TIB32681.1 hypothetical protein E3P86_03107 [Wallemia ichthyophaga]